MRAWIKMTAALFVALPFAATAVRAEPESTKPTPESNEKKIEKLQKEVAQLNKEMEQLRKDVTDNSANGLKVAGDLRDIKEMLRSMAPRQDAVVRKSGYDERSLKPAETTAPATATIVLENIYNAAATVRINDRYYRVEPNQTRTIYGVPLGMFQYSVEVDGYGATEGMPRADRLPTEGYRIRVFPRMPSL